MKKRMLAVLLASVTACSLGGCAGKKKDTVRTVKIGLTLYDQYDTFISELVSWFNASASALEEETGTAINVEVVDAAGSQTTQNEQVKSLIEKGCDVICENLVDRTEPTTITDMAEKNDVPIIFFNRELVAEDLERWEKLYYVGADAFGSGIIEGELAAETFYRAMVALPDFRGECAASTWLCQIARNTWTSLRRKEGRCQPLDDTAALPDSRDFAAAFEDKDLALRIHRLLHRLPEPYREVFLLRVLGELSFRDIGSLIEKGENWACVTYHRARKKIMEQMEGTP